MLTWWDTFKINVSLLWRHAVAWVIGMWGIGYAYWLTLSPVEQQGYYDMAPFGLGKFAPLVLFIVSYIAAHGWPQPVLEQKLTEKVTAKQIDIATRPTPL